jgi:hypothetical protein
MTVEDMMRHRLALRERQKVLRELDDELAAINARYQDELRRFYWKKSERLRDMAFNGVPAAIMGERKTQDSGRNGQ